MTALAATVDLDDGARITSLRGDGGEWLLVPEGARDRRAFVGASLGGWDEMLPTIDACSVAIGDDAWSVGDHGDVWPLAWSGTAAQHEVSTEAFRLRRSVALTEQAMVLRYRLESTAALPLPVLWAPHPQLLLDDASTLDVGVAATWRRPGEPGPGVVLPRRFAPASLVEPGDGAKLWLDRPIDGVTLHRSDGWSLRLRWNGAVLPNLAIWIDRGLLATKQVVVVEPASSGHDSLADAVADGSARWLEPGAIREWSLVVEERAPGR